MHMTLGKAGGMLALALVALAGCGKGDEKFRVLLDPVVARITQVGESAASLTNGPTAAAIERTGALLTDVAGLGADLKAIAAEGEKQQSMVAAGQAYLSATQRFVTAQQEFARAYARMEAARVKVRESLDAKVRTSQHSMDFWKESHERLLVEIEAARKECEKIRDRVASATTGLQQASEAAGTLLGPKGLITAATLDAHRQALAAVPLEKGA